MKKEIFKYIKIFLLISIISVSGVSCSSIPDKIDCAKPGTLKYKLFSKTIASVLHDNGMIDYRKLKANHKLLDEFVNSIKCVGPETTPQFFPSKQDKIAFWINVHNAVALQSAVKKYPCKSVYSFWRDFNTSTRAYVDGKLLTLAQIAENARKVSDYDPRVELALSIPAKGSPKLTKELFCPEKLDSQLDNAVQRALDDNKLILIAHEDWAIKLGKPFWRVRKKLINSYKQIFNTPQASIVNALGLYANEAQRKRLNTAIGYNVRPLAFDWALNDDSQAPCSLDNLN